MRYFTAGYRLPAILANPLFGDRRRFGLTVQPDDPCWMAWQNEYCLRFYEGTQRKSVGAKVNDAGYRVMSEMDLTGLRILEIGPGEIQHIKYWKGRPDSYVIADIRQSMLDRSSEILRRQGVKCETALLSASEHKLPFNTAEFDLIVSFYSLEHIYPLGPYLDEMARVLKVGGQIVGAIPAEGGLAWGLGRYLTSRRWIRNNTPINPDKIICWEHPNFADSVLTDLDARLQQVRVSYWPLHMPLTDLNLIIKLLYVKR